MEVFDWQAFHFLRPFALLGVVPAVLIAIWYAVRQTGRERFASLLSPELQGVLVTGSDGGRRWLVAGMIAAMLGLGAITIAGPTWQRQDVPSRDLDDALVVLFDLSLSMHAEDITPSRLHRARRELADLLTLREEGTTALIAYAGDAHVVTPLTDDVDTIRHMSDSLTPEIMPILGSRTPVAIELANQLLENGAEEKGRILLITDGIRGLEASASACDTRYPLSILGVGTAAGAPVPVPVGEGR
ncbi:MAG: VWA domain-containing protein, partial [Gammaproteobacteria bacterium]|nr:VWA domain-containing protein [Gammaproteobacteria bacterium]